MIKEYIYKIAPNAISLYETMKEKKANVVLFGAAKKGRRFLKDYAHLNLNVLNFCDDDGSKWGSYINGIKVVSPEELVGNGFDIPIIITSKWSDGITEKLRSKGFRHIYHRFSIDYLIHMEELQRTYDLLEDKLSKEVFLGLVKYVFTQRPEIFEEITLSEEQYFLTDIFDFSIDECIIDGGAFTGDTLQKYYELSDGRFKEIYCFEPDDDNFYKLSENVNKIIKTSGDIKIYNLGLFNKAGKVYFSNSHNSAACIVDEANYHIQVTSIDEVIKTNKVTMIKLDVEGAEVETIMGAKNTIMKQKPKLAICNYHLSSDLWEIPLVIRDLVPQYKIYLRHHNSKCWYESVVYAKL